MSRLTLLALVSASAWPLQAGGPPYPAALEAAAIHQTNLNSLLDRALLLGNGDINGLCFERDRTLVLRLTKNDVWDARIDTSQDPPLTTIDVRAQTKSASDGSWKSWEKNFPCPLMCAEIVLSCLPSTADKPETTALLDLRRAVARIRQVPPGGGSTELRALWDRNAFLILSPATPKLVPRTAPWLAPAETGTKGNAVWLKQSTAADPDWPGMSWAVAMATNGTVTAVSIVSSREARDVVASAVRIARQTAASNAARLIAAHERAWDGFWAASGVRLQNRFLESVWYRNLYFLRTVSKPGVEAVGLFAGLVSDVPAWHGGHTINYNTQQAFWSASPANHPELSEPLERLTLEYLPRAKWLARTTYDCDGAFYPHNLYPCEPPDPEKCHSNNRRAHVCSPWAHTLGNSGFLAQNLWLRYKYQPDKPYLKRVAYPVVSEVAKFYAEFIERCPLDATGKARVGPSVSPEHWGWTTNMDRNINVTFDLAFMRVMFEAVQEATAALNRDASLAARCSRAMATLPPYPVTSGPEPIVVDVAGAPPMEYNIAVPAVPVFPAGVVDWFSPEPVKALFGRTLQGLRWNGNNSSIIMPVALARLSSPGAAEYLESELRARSRPNGTITLSRLGGEFNNFGNYTEQFASTMAVSELLLQSTGDVLRLFPAWPSGVDAEFANLRAQGGFLVSAAKRAGTVEMLQVRSTAGGKLRLLSPWRLIKVNGKPLLPDQRGVISLETRPGDHYTFSGGN